MIDSNLGYIFNKAYINHKVSLSYNLFGSIFSNSEMRTWKTQADAIFWKILQGKEHLQNKHSKWIVFKNLNKMLMLKEQYRIMKVKLFHIIILNHSLCLGTAVITFKDVFITWKLKAIVILSFFLNIAFIIAFDLIKVMKLTPATTPQSVVLF